MSKQFTLKCCVQLFRRTNPRFNLPCILDILYTGDSRTLVCSTQQSPTSHGLSVRLVETRLTRRAAAKKCEGAARQGRREEATDVRCGARPGSHARTLGAWTHHHRAEVFSYTFVLL